MTLAQTLALVFLVVFAVTVGYYTANKSRERETIYGGPLALISNFIASMLAASIAPTVIVATIIFHSGLINALIIAVIMIALSLLALLVYAIVENPAAAKALANQVDRGWTREDAETSGL